MTPPRIIVIMGASGAGKTTIGEALAHALGWRFLEGDAFHSRHNIEKMAAGHALTDDDRAPWLASIRGELQNILAADTCAVLACSALKEQYRVALTPRDAEDGAVRFVMLDVPASVLRDRVSHREGHYMPPSLVGSQLATLEPPRHEIIVDGTEPPEAIISKIRAELAV